MNVSRVLIAIAWWGVAVGVSLFTASLIAKLGRIEDGFTQGVIIQLSFAVLSVLVVGVAGSIHDLGLSLDLRLSIIALIVAVSIGLPLAYLAATLTGNYRPPFVPEDPRERIAVALIIAPIGEELLFRGLLEGQLLKSSSMWVAVTIPALLFSLMHVAPFSGSPKAFLGTLLVSALVLGLLAGYLRAISNSLLPAIAVHAGFNLAGNLISLLIR